MTEAGDSNVAEIGSLLGNRARARVLLALADGRALCASVLAREARVSPPTISHHLSKLVDAGLLSSFTEGRHRHFKLASVDVADLLETAARLAPAEPVVSLRQGTRAQAVRYARSCYGHLAGRLGVALTDALLQHDAIQRVTAASEDNAWPLGPGEPPIYVVSKGGAALFAELGASIAEGGFARGCLDWTEHRPHVGGAAARTLLTRLLELGWLSRAANSRALTLTSSGRKGFTQAFAAELAAVVAGATLTPES